MTFRLSQLFLLVGACACWFSLFLYSRNIGVLVLISLLPASLTIGAHRGLRNRFQTESTAKRIGMLAIVGFMWLSVYVLSVGPVVVIVDRLNWERKYLPVIYAPVVWLHGETILKKPLKWYADRWGVSLE